MGVELVPTPKAPQNRSLAIRFVARYLSTAHAPVWSQRPRAHDAGYGEQSYGDELNPQIFTLVPHEIFLVEM